MLSISLPMKGAGKGEYYLRLAQEDYFFNKGEPMGEWHGRGAERLGLSGRIVPDHMRRLLDGHSPDGKRDLIQNARHKDRQSGWDLTFSPPKSLSTLWALAADQVRPGIEAVHRRAVHAGLGFLQENAGKTRRGKGGRIRESADLIFAIFRHSTSREQDPQLHSHVLLINTCVRKDGSTGAVWSKDFFDLKMQAGAVYARTLAAEMERCFGLTVEWEPTGFHITGVPRGLCEIFSKRRAQINAYLAEHNESGAIAAKSAALSTRRKKTDVSRQKLFAAWRQTGDTFGWSSAQAEELMRKGDAQLKERRDQKQRRETEAAQAHTTVQVARKVDETTGTNAEAQAGAATSTESTESTQSRSANGETEFQEQADAGKRRSYAGQGSREKQHSSRTKAKRQSAGQGRKSKQRRDQTSGNSNSANDKTSRRQGRRNRQRRTRGIGIEWQPVFPKAPHWSPFHKWQLPRIVIGRDPVRRWGKIRWRQNFWLAELRLQERHLFPNAPGWSPARNWTLPSLRFGTKIAKHESQKQSAEKQSKASSQSH